MNDNDYLSDFFEYAPVGFHIFGPDRKFIAVNQTELSMIGYGREEIIGKKTWSDLIVPEQKPFFEQHWAGLLEEGRAVNFEYTVVHKSGRHIDVVLNASARKDDSGRIINTRGSVLDITRRKQLEEEALNVKNIALGEILARFELEKKQVKKDMMANVEELVLPLLTKLKRRGTPYDRQNVQLLEDTLRDITSPFAGAISDRQWRLSPREIEICNMIRKGLSTKDISHLLNTSHRTVENHRNSIRKKLKIARKGVNLVSYLQDYLPAMSIA
ncbi:MAG: PAS domain S-box protein [Candidatus Omnitrophica bacterium]|nr:PAS domain S-box protein [Candidatus Omnitrophota bacterium]MDE2008457.1 PAS domain S-box protein [Candidatus Omnitrophota bacterium]MDE2214795.1 PAS domain S-box protein [Candidatus Omnitrophota bacterium]MDE2231422.1 PAS domain S-box protein [Candidatus Omnitrophota bacterium]